MPLKPVAKQGDVSATAGTTVHETATTGSWSAGPVTPVPYAFLTIGGTPVVHEASCVFTFNGSNDSSGTPVTIGPIPVTVTLTAASTTLQKGTTFVLRDGDSTQDSYGNKLEASAANNLQSD